MIKTDKDLRTAALKYSSKQKLVTKITAPLEKQTDMSLAYTPGIAQVSQHLAEHPEDKFKYTFTRNNLAVISNGTAVLGLGKIGAVASYPVMEGKAMLFKKFANIDAIPIVVNSTNPKDFVKTVVDIADSFGAINLEDIAAPECFEIESQLQAKLDIPIMHDDQHGTAVVVLAAVLSSLKLIPHQGLKSKIVISGAGAAGVAITKILLEQGFENIIVVDSAGAIHQKNARSSIKKALAKLTNPELEEGSLGQVLDKADIFIGVSKADLLKTEYIERMNPDPIIIAMANPNPEIKPDKAIKAGAGIVGTGRSDYPNQINNALAFPGIFRGAIDRRKPITAKMKLAAAKAIVEYHQNKLSRTQLLPSILDPKVHQFIAAKVAQVA